MFGILGVLGAYIYVKTAGWIFGVLALIFSVIGLNRRMNTVLNIGFGMVGFLWTIYLFWRYFGGQAFPL